MIFKENTKNWNMKNKIFRWLMRIYKNNYTCINQIKKGLYIKLKIKNVKIIQIIYHVFKILK